MNEKLRTHDPVQKPIASGEPEGDALTAAREQMDSLLAAADTAINAALTQDSAAFLSATTQRGGQ